MAQVPQISTDPIEILTNRNLVEEPYVNQYWGPGIFGGLTFIGVCVSNWYMKRPVYAGFQRHLILTPIAAIIGKYFDEYRSGYLAERDAALRHYILLHREDFPDFERKKYADVFEQWIPIR